MTAIDQRERIDRDTAELRRRHGVLTERAGDQWDRGRLLVVISAAGQADRHLQRSLPLLLAQTRACGLAIDLLLGCNHGFRSDRLNDVLQRLPDCDVELLRCEKSTAAEPAAVVDSRGYEAKLGGPNDGRDRIFVVHQAATAHSRGKIRMLSDLYGWIAASIDAGWTAPAYLLACDAESEFNGAAPWAGEGADEPALHRLVQRLDDDAALQIVGTRNRFAVFENGDAGELRPNFEAPLPSFQLYLNLVHARARGFEWTPGGGTLGRTAAMTAALQSIASLYPSMRIEDAMTTLMARAIGMRIDVESSVASINRCPHAHERRAADEQVLRWLGGSRDLELKYGRAFVRGSSQSSVPKIIWAGLRLTLREVLRAGGWRHRLRMMHNGIRILVSLQRFLWVYPRIRIDRSDAPGEPAHWD